MVRRLFCIALGAVLVACAGAPPTTSPNPADGEWRVMPLPGKSPTRYEWTEKEGRRAVMATADRSASMWHRQVTPALSRSSHARFSWWLQDAMPAADLADADRGDAPARVMFGFDGDISALPLRTRLMFELMQTLTGEQPPYATLMYVWDAARPVGTVLIHPRSDRVRAIVVDSGHDDLHRWRDHRRDLAADFRLAFGEEPGPLKTVALMTDSDNTGSRARTWYGAVELH